MNVSEYLGKYAALDETAAKKVDLLADFLVAENEKYNLTAITDAKDVAMLHFYDSITPLRFIAHNASLIDIGTGAGFPALPIALFRPDVDVTMLDSTAKKLAFAQSAAALAGLENTSQLCGRAEELSHRPECRERFTVATARGVAVLNVLCELALPFVKTGGYFIAMKGRSGGEEAQNAHSAAKALGAKLVECESVIIPETDHTHTLVVFEKTRPTPECYPRKYAAITKKPL
ncbi:MAG TPA: 16S rRNA (guanine(527)-N(7))-methyltransferase RsmG [Bacillota bacterium]|nr:16S rRNA (guanine(527)-N(7))-methyltransferase RsmG [Bacillota bacterium]